MRRIAWLLLLAGCAGGPPSGRWAGTATPETPGCGEPAHATLVARGGEAVLTPDDGTRELRGTIETSGQVAAALQARGIDHRPYVMRFDGQVSGDRAEGVMNTPRCRVRLDLTRR